MKFLKIFVFCLFFNASAKSQSIDIFQLVDILTTLNIDPEVLNNLAKLNLTDFNIGQICNYVNLANENVSAMCIKQLGIVCRNEDFLAHMIDASSKFPYSGILTGTRLDFGNFEECTTLETEENGITVLGKHCTGGFVIPVSPIPEGFEIPDVTDISNLNDFLDKAFKLSTCTPDACSSTDLLHLLNIPLEYPVFNELACNTKARWTLMKWDSIAVLSFLLFVLLIMVISTCFDMYGNFNKPRHPILVAFSVISNGKKLFKTSSGDNNKEQILVFNGLKVISIMWITGAHSFSALTGTIADNNDQALEWEWTRGSVFVTSAHLAVDTFFYISGFLCAYHYLKMVKSMSLMVQIKNIPYMILHRYLRLTPALLVAFLVFTTFYRYLGTGPAYTTGVDVLKDPCDKYWWSVLLYAQNYVNYDQVCMVQTWYLSVDMQLFLLTPLILIPISMTIKKHYSWTIAQLSILNVLVTVLPISLKLFFKDFENEFETHSRINIYLTGIMLGIFMKEKKQPMDKLSAKNNVIIWIVVLILMLGVVQAYKEVQLIVHENDKKYTTYFILLRAIWSVGLSWIVYSSHNGHGGIINWFLTRPLFQIMSKLTYSIYLIHMMVYCHLVLSTQTRLHFSQYLGITNWISGFVITTFIAIFWSLAFESPIIVIEAMILKKISEEPTKSKKITNGITENTLDFD